MDLFIVNDLFLECVRAVVLIALLGILFWRGRFTVLSRQAGWKSILVGFTLVTFATLLDITDEIPGLERYVLIGDTGYEAFLEKIPGYLLGFLLILVGFYKMIPSLQNAEQNERELLESEERFRQVFVANPDPVILARLNTGVVIDVNPAFVEQTGFSLDETIGKNSADLNVWVRPEQRDEFRSQLQRQGHLDNYEADFIIKDGSICPCLLSAKILTISGDPCMLVVSRNITRIKEAELALLETDRIRREFISTAAHELRTPLSVLIGYVELLTTPEGTDRFTREQRDEFFEEVKTKGFVLSKLVDELLDISRIDAGQILELQLEMTSPDCLLRKIFEQYKLQVPARQFALDLKQGDGFECLCDRQRIQQVLENLLSNAVKYSAEGCMITLSSQQHQDVYEFTVSDEGYGMTQEQIERIFDKFYRVDSSNTAVSGLGLGMSIVKQIIDAHDGTIDVDSSLGKGTSVKVRLPIRKI